jgi:hypothetical protein
MPTFAGPRWHYARHRRLLEDKNDFRVATENYPLRPLGG